MPEMNPFLSNSKLMLLSFRNRYRKPAYCPKFSQVVLIEYHPSEACSMNILTHETFQFNPTYRFVGSSWHICEEYFTRGLIFMK